MEKLFQEFKEIARNRENRQINLETNIKSLGGIQGQFCFRVAFPILPNLIPRVFRLFGQRGNTGKTLGTSNFITAGFLR